MGSRIYHRESARAGQVVCFVPENPDGLGLWEDNEHNSVDGGAGEAGRLAGHALETYEKAREEEIKERVL